MTHLSPSAGPGGATVVTAPPKQHRRAWPDNLKVLLIILVLAHHCALTYGHIPLWPYYETPATTDTAAGLLDLLVFVNQAWFMGLFFLISGLFAPGSVDRHGVGAFVRGRLMRLGIPYLIFVLLLRPLYTLPLYLSMPAAERPAFGTWYLVSFDSAYAWFLLVLLVFSLGYAGLRALGAPRAERFRIRALRPGIAAVLLISLLVGVVIACWRLLVPEGSYWPYIGLPSPAYLPQYLACFAIGVLAGRFDWLERLPVRTGVAAAPIALVTGVLGFGLVLSPAPVAGGFPATMLLTVFAGCLMTALIVLFRSRLDRINPVLASAGANAFAIYLIHGVVLVFVASAIGPLVQGLPALGKFAVLLVLGGATSWALAAAIRRIPRATAIF